MTTRGLLLVSVILSLHGCGAPAPDNEVFLVGQVYDGATGARLTAYTMTVQYRDQTLTAEVSPTGRFLVRKLPVYQDYTVEIVATDYRPFRSHNVMFNVPNPGSMTAGTLSTTQTFYFDSYLFPSGLQTPALALNVRKDSSTGPVASGKVRIRPTTLSLLTDTPSETPAGVGAQLWLNDEDLQSKPISADFTDGLIQINAGDLVYGVRYLVSIYEVDGYQPFEGQITAGADGSKTFVLTVETSDPLMLVQPNVVCARPNTPTDTVASVISFDFNFDIELSTSTYPGGFAELVDDGFQMTSINTNGDINLNTLGADVSPAIQERGTTTVVSGKTVTFAWNPSTGLATKDAGDTISQVRWNVSGVTVQPVGKPQQKQLLGTLYPNASFITCN